MMKKILIVEDNIDLLNMYEIAFKSKGYDVRTSTDGGDAIIEIIDFHPDFVLLDLMMPGINGFVFLEDFKNEIESNNLEKPIIAVNSNLDDEINIQKALTMGADYFFKKSDYTPIEIVNKVDMIFGF